MHFAIVFTLLLAGATVFEMNNTFQKENYFILHYMPGPSWDDEKAPNEQAWFAEHSRFLSSLRTSGRAKIGGRYADKGMIIFTARDKTQADSLLSTDPSITHGTFRAEVYPISFFYRGSITKPPPDYDNEKNMDPIITKTVILNTTVEEAFRLFTENELLESWLTVKADVVPEPGGKYELFWEPDDPKNNSTIGCKVLAVEHPVFINFEWKGPKQYKHFMNDVQPLTNVTVMFSPREEGTKVTLLHTGWRESAEWEEARQYFVNAWNGAFRKLEEKVNSTESPE